MTYDRLGRRVTASNALGVRTFSYHATTELSSESVSGLYTNTLIRGIDGFGRPASLTLSGGLYGVAYAYGAHGSLAAITSIVGGVTSRYDYAFDPGMAGLSTIAVREASATVLSVHRGYDASGRLLQTETRNGSGVTVARYSYGYDALSRRTNVQHLAGDAWVYGYNARSELTSAVRRLATLAPLPGQDYAYAYDAIGNRTSARRAGQASTYSANSLNQYANRTVPGVIQVLGTAHTGAVVALDSVIAQRAGTYFYAAAGVDNSAGAVYDDVQVAGMRAGVASGGGDAVRVETGRMFVAKTPEVFSYDTDGNLLEDGRWTYAWDGENRLKAMETRTNLAGLVPRVRLEFVYDGESRRVAKRVYGHDGGWVLEREVRFVYDGWNMIREAGAGPLRSQVWGLDLSLTPQGAGGIGGLLAVHDHGDGRTRYPAYDGHGNVIALLTATNSTTALYEYDAYGNLLRQSGTDASAYTFRYSTKYEDAETGLVYYGYRYYSPGLGRWLNRDPIGEEGGINLYGFVQNSPITFFDALGLVLFTYEQKFYTFTGYGQGISGITSDKLDILGGSRPIKYTEHDSHGCCYECSFDSSFQYDIFKLHIFSVLPQPADSEVMGAVNYIWGHEGRRERAIKIASQALSIAEKKVYSLVATGRTRAECEKKLVLPGLAWENVLVDIRLGA